MKPVARTHAGPAIASLSLGAFGFGLTEFATMGLLSNIASGFSSPLEVVAYGVSGYAVGVVIGAPAFTIFASRMDRRLLTVILMTVFIAGNVATVFAPSAAVFVAARVIAGLPHGAFFGVAADIVKRIVPRERLGMGIAFVGLGLQIANFAGVPVVTAIGQARGWRLVFIIVAVVGVVAVLAQLFTLPRAMKTTDGASVRADFAAFKLPRLWFGILIGSFGLTGVFAVYSYLGAISERAAGLSPSLLPVLQAIFGLGMIIGALVAGRLADWSATKATVLGLTVLVVSVLLFGVLTPIGPAMFATSFLVGVGSQLIGPALQIILMQAAPSTPALASAIYHSAFNIGNALGASIGGAFVAVAAWQGPAWAGAGVSSVGLLLAVAYAVAQRRTPVQRRARSGELHRRYRTLNADGSHLPSDR